MGGCLKSIILASERGKESERDVVCQLELEVKESDGEVWFVPVCVQGEKNVFFDKISSTSKGFASKI